MTREKNGTRKNVSKDTNIVSRTFSCYYAKKKKKMVREENHHKSYLVHKFYVNLCPAHEDPIGRAIDWAFSSPQAIYL